MQRNTIKGRPTRLERPYRGKTRRWVWAWSAPEKRGVQTPSKLRFRFSGRTRKNVERTTIKKTLDQRIGYWENHYRITLDQKVGSGTLQKNARLEEKDHTRKISRRLGAWWTPENVIGGRASWCQRYFFCSFICMVNHWATQSALPEWFGLSYINKHTHIM